MASELVDYILLMCLSWLVAKMRVGDGRLAITRVGRHPAWSVWRAPPPRGGVGPSILVVADVAAGYHVLVSHDAFDEEDSTGQDSQRNNKSHRDDYRMIVDTGFHRWAPSAPGLVISPSPQVAILQAAGWTDPALKAMAAGNFGPSTSGSA
jgi:hypothetical protein